MNKEKNLARKAILKSIMGVKPNELLNDWKSHNNDIHFSNAVGPAKQNFENQQNFTRPWRKADERMRKRMLEKNARKNTYKLYKPGEKVFIRLRRKGKDSLKKHRVFIGRILKRYEDDATYLVKVKIPVEAEPSVQKVRIENIANNS